MSFDILYSNKTFSRTLTLTQEMRPVAKSIDGFDIPLPNWVSFDYETKMMKIEKVPNDEVGKYLIGIEYGYKEFEDSYT